MKVRFHKLVVLILWRPEPLITKIQPYFVTVRAVNNEKAANKSANDCYLVVTVKAASKFVISVCDDLGRQKTYRRAILWCPWAASRPSAIFHFLTVFPPYRGLLAVRKSTFSCSVSHGYVKKCWFFPRTRLKSLRDILCYFYIHYLSNKCHLTGNRTLHPAFSFSAK
jgi:hypothetical protein